MYTHKVKLNLIEISPNEGWTTLSLQVVNQPDDYPDIYSYGQVSVAIPSQDAWQYSVGKDYDLNLNEVTVEDYK